MNQYLEEKNVNARKFLWEKIATAIQIHENCKQTCQYVDIHRHFSDILASQRSFLSQSVVGFTQQDEENNSFLKFD